MAQTQSIGLLRPGERNQWVRLRTLTWLRWVAISGQILAIAVASVGLGLDVPLGLCSIVIGAAIVANLLSIFVYPENKRLSETEAMLFLLFDAAQLAALLALTGGLNNPFCLLVLTPVTISATALSLMPTAVLGLFTALVTTILGFYHIPLIDASGAVLQLPEIFRFGFWIAVIIGIGFLAFYASRVMAEINSMSDALLATQLALAREQKLTDLGGVVAAAAHELGTPLATIKLTSSELLEELEDFPELAEDARLIREQADRCRDILRSMGRAGKDDKKLHTAPLANVIEEAAEPHANRGKTIHLGLKPEANAPTEEPLIMRRPEVIHGLRNLVQNAVDFSQEHVWVDAFWNERTVRIRIADDGQGYAQNVLNRIGDPFMRRRRAESDRRPGYEGMGLGLFIAKTLLERSGATLSFANGPKTQAPIARRGAIVEVEWPRARICAPSSESEGPLGENQPF